MFVWIECRDCGWVRRDHEPVSRCPECGGTVDSTEMEDHGIDSSLEERWTSDRIQRLNERNRAFRPSVGGLWHDEDGHPFRWDGDRFVPEEHNFAPKGAMCLDWNDPMSLGGLVKRVSETFGPRAYQEEEEPGVWRSYASGLYGRSPQIGEGSTRLHALLSSMRRLGAYVMRGAPDEILPRRQREPRKSDL